MIEAPVRLQHLGLIEYAEALALQQEAVDRGAETGEEVLFLCSHPPVVTLGRGTQSGDVFSWKGPLVEVQRGGRATYHGPSQMIAYPILNLDRFNRDLHQYLRFLERVLIQTLNDFGIEGDRKPKETGVWVKNKKIASIGVGVRRWMSFHGIALNVHHDPNAFQGIHPCGYSTEVMTSMEKVTDQSLARESIEETFVAYFRSMLMANLCNPAALTKSSMLTTVP